MDAVMILKSEFHHISCFSNSLKTLESRVLCLNHRRNN